MPSQFIATPAAQMRRRSESSRIREAAAATSGRRSSAATSAASQPGSASLSSGSASTRTCGQSPCCIAHLLPIAINAPRATREGRSNSCATPGKKAWSLLLQEAKGLPFDGPQRQSLQEVALKQQKDGDHG